MSDKKQKSIMDPDNYHKLCAPFESQEAAGEAVEEFWKEFYELRNKHKLPDVYVIMRVITPEGDLFTRMHAGSQLYAEPMAAWAFGCEQADRETRIVGMMSATKASGPKRSRE